MNNENLEPNLAAYLQAGAYRREGIPLEHEHGDNLSGEGVNPADPFGLLDLKTKYYIWEDFIGQGTLAVATSYGPLVWQAISSGTGANVFLGTAYTYEPKTLRSIGGFSATSALNHPGRLRCTTGINIGSMAGFANGSSSFAGSIQPQQIAAGDLFKITFYIYLLAAEHMLRLGLFGSTAIASGPSVVIYPSAGPGGEGAYNGAFYFEHLATDTNWFGVNSQSIKVGATNRVDIGTTFASTLGGWHKFTIENLGSNNISYTIDNASAINSSSLPDQDNSLNIGMAMINRSQGINGGFDIDYVSLLVKGLQR
jgi:hypothetical protein